MTNQLFDTPGKIDAATAAFKMMIGSPGWAILKEIVQANIETITKRLLDGSEGETTESINRLRDKLNVYKEVINTPQNIIDRLTSTDPEDENYDPYETVEEMNKRKQTG